MSTDTVTVQALAREAYEAFESLARDGTPDERLYRLKDGAPEWLGELVRVAHGEFFPDDWRYEAIMDACCWISEVGDPYDDERGEFADSHVDVYNGALLEWLSSSGYRVGYCEEAVTEFGIEADAGIYRRIALGQYAELEEVYGLVLGALEERAGGKVDEG